MVIGFNHGWADSLCNIPIEMSKIKHNLIQNILHFSEKHTKHTSLWQNTKNRSNQNICCTFSVAGLTNAMTEEEKNPFWTHHCQCISCHVVTNSASTTGSLISERHVTIAPPCGSKANDSTRCGAAFHKAGVVSNTGAVCYTGICSTAANSDAILNVTNLTLSLND